MNTENHYTETDLGNISPNPRGAYDPEATYEYLDLVAYTGGSYLCTAELGTTITGIAPAQGKTTEYWQCITIPGGLTPEYVATHDDVVNKAASVAEDTKAVREAKENVESMEVNVQILQEQATQAAEEAERSKDSAAGYALAAEESRQAAKEAEENVNAQVSGFDAHVTEKTEQAETEIEATRIAANKAVVAQQTESVQEVKDQTAAYISEKQTEAENAVKKVVEDYATGVEADIQRVNAAGDDQIRNVNKAGTDNIALVNNSGAAQVQNVQREGDVQVGNVQAAAAEIEADREQIETNRKNVSNAASAIKKDAKGEMIMLQDSAKMPFALKMYGKADQVRTTGAQLWNIQEAQITDNYKEYITVKPDDWIEIECDNTEGTETKYLNFHTPISNLLEPGKEYLGILEIRENNKGRTIYVNQWLSTIEQKPQFLGMYGSNASSGIFFFKMTTMDDFTNCVYMTRSFVSAEAGIKMKVEFRISVVEDTSVTADTFVYEPYTGGKPSPSPEYPQDIIIPGTTTGLKLGVYGNNLAYLPDVEAMEINGVIWSCKNGVVTATGEIIGDNSSTYGTIFYDLPPNAGTYFINGSSDEVGVYCYVRKKGGLATNYSNTSFVLDGSEEAVSIYLRINIKGEGKEINKVVYPMLNIGETALPWEPAKPLQTLSFMPEGGLPGIPVSSGGNYIDKNGQQWIANYRDWERGVDVLYTEKIIINADADIVKSEGELKQNDRYSVNVGKLLNSVGMSNQHSTVDIWGTSDNGIGFGLGTSKAIYFRFSGIETLDELRAHLEKSPLVVLYALATPIETPIPAEELAAYKALHLNRSNTTILDTENLMKEVVYNVDTESYLKQNYVPKEQYETLEQRVAALEAQTVNSI